MLFKNFKRIKKQNGTLASVIIYAVYLEKRSGSKFLKFLRKVFWQPILNLQLAPRSFTDIESILSIRFPHPFMIIIHEYSQIGRNCVIYHECTIGMREHKSLIPPKIGDNVYIGCKATILGNVEIGDNSTIGAGSIVLKTAPHSRITGLYA